jgi:hypothetical protein
VTVKERKKHCFQNSGRTNYFYFSICSKWWLASCSAGHDPLTTFVHFDECFSNLLIYSTQIAKGIPSSSHRRSAAML